jgi:hypothetical protein
VSPNVPATTDIEPETFILDNVGALNDQTIYGLTFASLLPITAT